MNDKYTHKNGIVYLNYMKYISIIRNNERKH